MDTESLGVEQNQYLTFYLDREEFGVGILKVKEILEYSTPTSVPMVPEFIQGVINLRGSVVPVIDLKAKFQMPDSDITKKSCVIIIEVNMEGDYTTMGILVDAVSEVMDIAPKDIEPSPSFGARIKVDFIQGMAKLENQFVMLLDLDKVLSIEELAVMHQLKGEQPVSQEGGGGMVTDAGAVQAGV
jgi:purine-binding chemotaxis protein CheW